MADKKDVPPIPVPPAGADVPPIEPPPVTPPLPPVAGAPLAPPMPPSAQPPVAVNPYATPGPYAVPPAGPAQGLSITSMILGIVGVLAAFIGWGFLPALGAVITGHLATKRQPYAKPFWLTGIITGYVGIGISLIAIIVLAVVVFGFLAVCAGAASCR